MFISSEDARSAISSSLRMASVMSRSTFRASVSVSALPRSSGVFSLSVISASLAARLARSSPATSRSIRGLRVPPFSHTSRACRASGKSVSGCPPTYCRMTAASSVSRCAWSISKSVSKGTRARHFSAPGAVRAPSASISLTRVNSSTRSVLSVIMSFLRPPYPSIFSFSTRAPFFLPFLRLLALFFVEC